MKDNYPNYLNPHNIDPGRVEAARMVNEASWQKAERKRILASIEKVKEMISDIEEGRKDTEHHDYIYPAELQEMDGLLLKLANLIIGWTEGDWEAAIEKLNNQQPDPITGLVPCGCGGKLVLHKCSDREFMTTFYIECDNEECRLSVGRRYDPINHCRRGEFTDAKSAIEASNRAMGYIPMELSMPLPEVEK